MKKVKVTIEEDVFLPVYSHLLPDEETDQHIDIEFLYGGRDSGKSRHIAQELIRACLREPYFRCLLTRKVFNTIKDSQWQLLKDVVEEWNLDRFFTFTVNPLGIRCVNGNTFLCRGLDNPGRVKSVNNPSHCWVEEGNQIDNDDWVILLTTLRRNDGNVKTWFSFNPECDNYLEFWLYNEYFSHTTEQSFIDKRSIEANGEIINYTIRATHTTYRDNPYCAAQRIALYEGYKNSKNNKYYYDVYTLGRWGLRKRGGEFWKCFEEAKHVHKLAITNEPDYRAAFEENVIHVVVDNNVSPYIAVQFWQVNAQNKKLDQVGELCCEHPNNRASKAAKKVVEWLKNKNYRLKVIWLYGDPSANAESTNDDSGKSFFDKFKDALYKEGIQPIDKVKKSAPRVAISAEFVNEIWESNYGGWDIRIDSGCRVSILDYNVVQEDVDGTMLKKKVKDPETERTYEPHGHFSDNLRYFITSILPDVFDRFAASRKFNSYSVSHDDEISFIR